MPKVYVVQVPARRDGARGGWVEKYDLSAAEPFGELVPILPYGNVPSDPAPTVARLTSALSAFDPVVDSLLLLGDPVAISQATAILARRFPGGFGALKWLRREGRYEWTRVG